MKHRCPVCNSTMKTMYKAGAQLHCRGKCGLIMRVQNQDYHRDLVDIVIGLNKITKPTQDNSEVDCE